MQDSQLSGTERETHTSESDLRRSGKQRNGSAKKCGVSMSDECGGILPVMYQVVPILQ